MSRKSVLITGSAGFIGSHLAEHYLKSGYQVTGIDNYLTGTRANTERLSKHHETNFKFIEHDASRPWPEIKTEGLSLVFHFASPASVRSYQKHPLETLAVNSTGLKNALSFADKNHARLVFSSTSEIYGSPLSTPQKENDWGHVNSFGERSCYDEAKRFGEALIYAHNKTRKTHHGLVRIFNTYGPRMNPEDDRVVNSFLKNARQNEALSIYGDGLQTRSFCYIDDLIAGITAYADSRLTEPVNLGNDTETSVLELADTILRITSSNSSLSFKDLPQDDPPRRRPDLTLAKKYLNYSPRVSLEEGIKKFILAMMPENN